MLAWSVIYIASLAGAVSARPIGFYTHVRRATLDTGSCGSPEIKFANGLDGRTQPAFAPVDSSFNHGSALNIGVISGFICQQLNDKCKAPQATLDTCTQAQSAASQVTGGAAADAFNAAFGIQTDFASVDGSSGASSATVTTSTAATTTVDGTAATSSADVTTTATTTAATTASATAAAGATALLDLSAALNFGSCTDPAIEFGPAFDGRKATEFAFEPFDKTSINHGSALNIDIITQATCDQLKTKCQAPADTLTACALGQQAASSASKGGAQADAFNAALGIKTNFASVPAAPGGGLATADQIAAANTPGFGSCTNPTIAFGIFDGRTENSFEPANLQDFNHGSALNINIITQFICDTFVNKCGANQAAINSCAAAKQAVNGLTGQAAADAFNNAVVQPVSA